MSYQVIARKWRPQNFEEVIGQTATAQTLRNAILQNRIAHAYLFAGARGVGKTSTARILAKALNCVQGPTANPCNVCDACTEITSGNSLDVLEIDAASNRGIDEIRELRENVKYAAVIWENTNDAGSIPLFLLDFAEGTIPTNGGTFTFSFNGSGIGYTQQ